MKLVASWLALLLSLGACTALEPASKTEIGGALSAALPLGRPGLPQTVDSEAIAPGITHYRVRRGTAGASAAWQLVGDIAQDAASLAKISSCFARAGLPARVAQHHIAGADKDTYTTVSGGTFRSRAVALDAAKSAAAGDCRLYPRDSLEDDVNLSGPWIIDIVAIDPRPGRHLSALAAGPDTALRIKTSELARAANAVVAVNGGFFVLEDRDGFPGQPSGISILSGKVNSAPVNMRPALVLPNSAGGSIAIVRKVDWNAYLEWSDGTHTPIDGINRKLGIARNCGRTAQDKPIHDYTCAYADDVVYYPAGSRFANAVASGVRFAIDSAGAVRRLAAGDAVGASDALLAAAGSTRVAQVQQLAQRKLKTWFKVRSNLPGTSENEISAINAGPSLVIGGAYVREDANEGWAIDAVDDPAHKLLMHDWINRRNPRTAIGVRKDGAILLVAVGGHDDASSVGLTIEELRQLFGVLGARDAVNLDGGGSTAMYLRDRQINRPSDAAGERAIGDAIVLRLADPAASGLP